jgi:hypothetical protein
VLSKGHAYPPKTKKKNAFLRPSPACCAIPLSCSHPEIHVKFMRPSGQAQVVIVRGLHGGEYPATSSAAEIGRGACPAFASANRFLLTLARQFEGAFAIRAESEFFARPPETEHDGFSRASPSAHSTRRR